MSSAEMKSDRELRVFREFSRRSSLAIDPSSIVSRVPPEPDILCDVQGEGPVAFELKEICDEDLAETMSALSRRSGMSETEEPAYVRLGGPGPSILARAKAKRYETCYPIELVFYDAGRVVLFSDAAQRIRDCFSDGCHQFGRVWYMGRPDETCECVFASAERGSD